MFINRGDFDQVCTLNLKQGIIPKSNGEAFFPPSHNLLIEVGSMGDLGGWLSKYFEIKEPSTYYSSILGGIAKYRYNYYSYEISEMLYIFFHHS